MTRRVATYTLTATVASFGATIAATTLYLVLVLGERPDVTASFFFGLQPALRGIVLAAPAAMAFGLGRPHINRTTFVVSASATASILGALLGFWVVGDSPHVSAQMAAVLLAATWAIAGCILSLFTGRSPNSRLQPT
jgi:hypothetical protein